MNKILIEWTYTPKSFLEETHEIEFQGNHIILKDGKIILITTQEVLNTETNYAEKAEEYIENYLKGVSIRSHSSYELDERIIYRMDQDRNFVSHSIPTIEVTLKDAIRTNVEVTITDKDGNVTHDSKKERIDEKKSWGQLISNMREEDQVLIEMYSNAIKEPDNELIHLFEILEYVSEKFGGRDYARKKLSISTSDINTFATIVNDPYIKEGRHRGKMADKLRKASPVELKSARRIAKNLILKYLKYQQSKGK